MLNLSLSIVLKLSQSLALKLSLITSATVVSIASAKVTLIASFIGVDCLIAGLGKSVWNGGLESEYETEEAHGIHIFEVVTQEAVFKSR